MVPAPERAWERGLEKGTADWYRQKVVRQEKTAEKEENRVEWRERRKEEKLGGDEKGVRKWFEDCERERSRREGKRRGKD